MSVSAMPTFGNHMVFSEWLAVGRTVALKRFWASTPVLRFPPTVDLSHDPVQIRHIADGLMNSFWISAFFFLLYFFI